MESTPLLRLAHLGVPLEVVVEGQLGSGWDVLDGEDANAKLAANLPLLSLAVWVAGVVEKPRQVALLPEERRRKEGERELQAASVSSSLSLTFFVASMTSPFAMDIK